MASEAVMEARRYMMEMKNCCQSTLCPFAERFDYAPEEMERMTVGFGGGMGHGDNCGAFVGGYLVLALAFGDDEEKTEEKQRAFREAFTARFGSPYCRELIGYDFAIPGEREKAFEAGVPQAKCPDLVAGTVEILEELLES